MHPSVTLWEKIDLEVLQYPATDIPPISEPEPGGGSDDNKKPTNWKRRFRIANVVSATLWILGLAKLFVYDIDRWAIERFTPSLSFLVDFRFFVLLGIVAIFLAVVQRSPLWLAYIALFPFVLIFWTIPRTLYKIGSWTVLLALLNMIYGFFSGLRRNFAIRTAEAIAILTILVTDNKTLNAIAASLLAVALFFHYGRAALAALRSSRFLRTQQRLVSTFFRSKFVQSMTSVQPALRKPEVQKFSKAQLDLFINSVSFGLIALKLTDFYAYLIDRYRRANTGFVFALASFAWIFIQSIIAYTFVNLAIWKVAPDQYEADSSPSILSFSYYSLNSMYANGVPMVEPRGELAIGISLFAGIYGPLLLLTLAAQVYFGYRQSKDADAFTETMAAIQKQREDLERRLESEYELPVEEAFERLQQHGLGLVRVIGYMASRFPGPNEYPGSDGRQ